MYRGENSVSLSLCLCWRKTGLTRAQVRSLLSPPLTIDQGGKFVSGSNSFIVEGIPNWVTGLYFAELGGKEELCELLRER